MLITPTKPRIIAPRHAPWWRLPRRWRTPRLRRHRPGCPLYRPQTLLMADGDAALDADGDLILDADGDAYLACCCTCCTSLPDSGNFYTITFSGVVEPSCTEVGTAPARWYSMIGSLNGTWCVSNGTDGNPCNFFASCVGSVCGWRYLTGLSEAYYVIYNSAACTTLAATDGVFNILLLWRSSTSEVAVLVGSLCSGSPASTTVLFSGATSATSGAGPFTINNDITAFGLTTVTPGTGTSRGIAHSGTATVTLGC